MVAVPNASSGDLETTLVRVAGLTVCATTSGSQRVVLRATAGTVAKQGLCFHYYGGTQSVTAGNLTIIWDATGVFRFTV